MRLSSFGAVAAAFVVPLLLALVSSFGIVEAKSLLVSSSGYSLNDAPLLLDGVNVGVGLAAAAQQIAALKQTVQQQQTAINQLTAKIDALLTPAIVEATAGDAEADVRWALASTTVTAAPGGASCTTNGLGGAQSCKISGLTNGINYTFTARLTNGAGMGDISPPSNPVTPGPQCRLLTLSAEGSGTLTATPPNSVGCPASSFTPGARILLAASPAAGFTLASWGGSLPGPTELQWQWDYTMPDSAAEQTATFAQCHSLAVELVGGGSAVSERVPSASAGCPAGFHIAGETVVLSLTAYNGAFAGWQAPVSSSDNPLVYHMPAGDATIVADVRSCYPLTVTSNGGTFTRSPSKSAGCAEGYYINGVSVALSVTVPTGYDFLGWTGAASGVTTSVTFVVPVASASVHALVRSKPQSTFASLVLGQPSFNTRVGNNLDVFPYGMLTPACIALDSADNLYVSDMGGHRIMVFAQGSTTPFRVIGQADFEGVERNRGAGVVTANSLNTPTGMGIDANDGLYVTDTSNSRVLYFEPGADTATRVYGQHGSFTTGTSMVGADGLGNSFSLALERDGSGLYIADAEHHRVLYYPGTSTTATRVIGQPDFDTITPGSGASGLNTPTSLALDSAGGLWICNMQDNRVLYFPAGSSVATRVLGQPDLVTTSSPEIVGAPNTATATRFTGAIGVSVDLADGVYVADMRASRVVYFAWEESSATRVWGQGGNFTLSYPNYRSTSLMPTDDSLYSPYFAPGFDSQNRMYIADTTNARVMKYDVL